MNNPEIIAGEDGRSRPVRTYDVRTREGTRHSEQMGNEAVFQVTGNPPALQLEFQANAPVSRVSSSDPAARTRRMGPSRVAVEIANGSTPEIRVHVRKKAENATVSVRERRR